MAKKKKIKKLSEHQQAKKRLAKAQAKYTKGWGNSNTGSVIKAPRASRSATAMRWKDWRESDGQEYPVETYNIKDIDNQ